MDALSHNKPRWSTTAIRNCSIVEVSFWVYLDASVCVCCRKFIDMGFIDKDRIAIWGWVSFHFFHICFTSFFLCKLFVFTEIPVLWSPVIWWLCQLHGSGCWNWTLQMWNSCRPGRQVGILWFVHLPAYIYTQMHRWDTHLEIPFTTQRWDLVTVENTWLKSSNCAVRFGVYPFIKCRF